MRTPLLLAVLLPLLTACATAPRPASPLLTCPRLPDLQLQDVPARDWLGQMRDFLSGSLPMQPDYSLPSTSAGQGIKPPRTALTVQQGK